MLFIPEKKNHTVIKEVLPDAKSIERIVEGMILCV